jgi:hypothetical protein
VILVQQSAQQLSDLQFPVVCFLLLQKKSLINEYSWVNKKEQTTTYTKGHFLCQELPKYGSKGVDVDFHTIVLHLYCCIVLK